jgi:hypothetical protein
MCRLTLDRCLVQSTAPHPKIRNQVRDRGIVHSFLRRAATLRGYGQLRALDGRGLIGVRRRHPDAYSGGTRALCSELAIIAWGRRQAS